MPKICFASDFHLGVPDGAKSLEREKKIVRWIKQECADADIVVFLGDVFDFWFEYKHVVPKGYTRLLGAIAELCDAGKEVYMFKGNHDMWMFGYLRDELGVKIIDDELVTDWHGKRFFLHHGDGLGPGDYSYKLIRKVFRNRVCQWLFAFIHPFWGISLAHYLSASSRIANDKKEQPYDEPTEWILNFCKEKIKTASFDYMVFGHRHLPIDVPVNETTRYINLGEWVHHFTYAVFDGSNLELKRFE
jgi:UDP-2,3-diacylglucosamine hydrolase